MRFSSVGGRARVWREQGDATGKKEAGRALRCLCPDRGATAVRDRSYLQVHSDMRPSVISEQALTQRWNGIYRCVNGISTIRSQEGTSNGSRMSADWTAMGKSSGEAGPRVCLLAG